jgi:16S rRNA (uracil1498-N3)-methyltransferase
VSAPLFLVDALPVGDRYRLDGPEGHHAATVQRLRVGEALLLCDGRGAAALATVTAVGRGTLDLDLGERISVPAPDPRILVVQGIAKGDRGELAVQAMTEVGVDGIVPWQAARSIARWRDDKPLQRWRATARESAKQARRLWLPPVQEPVTTGAAAGRVTFVLHEAATRRLATVDLPTAGEIVLAVGPEGGITDEEVTAFEAGGALTVKLGDGVLRTSTAGVAAVAALSVRLGRW